MLIPTGSGNYSNNVHRRGLPHAVPDRARYLAGPAADGMIAVGCASSATGIEDRRNVPRRTNTRG